MNANRIAATAAKALVWLLALGALFLMCLAAASAFGWK